MRRVRVHHFVVAGLARPQDPAWRVCDLFRVSHWYDLSPDTEFPYIVPRIHVFARFYLWRAKPTEFRVLVSWMNTPRGNPEEIGDFGPFTVPFTRDDTARDFSFNLHNVRLRGEGLHRIELVRERTRGWNAGELVPVATTFFVVER